MAAVPYFETIKRSYTDVDIANGINTEQFLEATEGVVKLFGKLSFWRSVSFQVRFLTSCCADLLGSAAFSVVQNDMNGNIKVN